MPRDQLLEPLPVGLVRRAEAGGVDQRRAAPSAERQRAHSRFLRLRSI